MAATSIAPSEPRQAMAYEALNLLHRCELLATAADVVGDAKASSLAEEVFEAAWRLRRHLVDDGRDPPQRPRRRLR